MRSQDLSIQHARLGEISISEDELFHLPGIPGFPDARRFVVREHHADSPFAWLICVDRDDLAFVIADPWNFFPDYRPAFAAPHLRCVDHREGDGLFAVVIARMDRNETTLNLAAPLLLNLRSRKGVQVVLDQAEYSPHEPVVQPGPDAPGRSSDRVETP